MSKQSSRTGLCEGCCIAAALLILCGCVCARSLVGVYAVVQLCSCAVVCGCCGAVSVWLCVWLCECVAVCGSVSSMRGCLRLIACVCDCVHGQLSAFPYLHFPS